MTDEVTKLLLDWNKGDQTALEQLIPLVYQELHRMAQRALDRMAQRALDREHPSHTLEATELLNEVYLRLIDCNRLQWQDRHHFFAVTAQMMRRVLVEEARKRNSQKRAEGNAKNLFDEAMVVSRIRDEELIALDEALERLERQFERKCRVVELRYFTGLSIEETANVLGVTPDTVKREWRTAKNWLLRELSHQIPVEHSPRTVFAEGPELQLLPILESPEFAQVEQEQDDHLLDDDILRDRVDRPLPYPGMKSLELSASRLAFYLLITTVLASVLLQLLTDDEIVIFFGTLNLAIISTWIWAWLRKIRLTVQHFRGTQQSKSEQPLLGELGNARRQ